MGRKISAFSSPNLEWIRKVGSLESLLLTPISSFQYGSDRFLRESANGPTFLNMGPFNELYSITYRS
jgi:hypothetical protein